MGSPPRSQAGAGALPLAEFPWLDEVGSASEPFGGRSDARTSGGNSLNLINSSRAGSTKKMLEGQWGTARALRVAIIPLDLENQALGAILEVSAAISG